MKKCGKCKIEKDESEFYKVIRTKDELRSNCKICHCKILSKSRKLLRKLKWKFPDKPYIGENHHSWKGMNVNYFLKHAWIRKHYGKANHCKNPDCKHISKQFDWANISGKYLREISDYKQLCRSCHILGHRGVFCKRGHKFTKENTYFRKDTGHKQCKICRKIRQEKFINRKQYE
jgi:hypothetical protein